MESNNSNEANYSEYENVSYSTTWTPNNIIQLETNNVIITTDDYSQFSIPCQQNYKDYPDFTNSRVGYCEDNFLLPSPFMNMYTPFNTMNYSVNGPVMTQGSIPLHSSYENNLPSFCDMKLPSLPQFRKKQSNGAHRQSAPQIQKELPALHVKSTGKKCSNCLCEETPSWRRDQNGINLLCNACGLYEKLHSQPRPIYVDKDGFIKVVRERKVKKSEISNQDFKPFPSPY